MMLNEVLPSERTPQSSPSRYACFAGRAGRGGGYGRILVRPVQARARKQLDTALVRISSVCQSLPHFGS
jgi:hypothetical protein